MSSVVIFKGKSHCLHVHIIVVEGCPKNTPTTFFVTIKAAAVAVIATVTRSVLNEYYKVRSTKPADRRQKTEARNQCLLGLR